MAARMTSIRTQKIRLEVTERGRKTRPEMIAKYRKHFEAKLLEAQIALSVPDEDLIVETHTGVTIKSNRKVVTE